jgi:hypothetical protein
VRRWELWTLVAGVLIGVGALFGVGWHINHETTPGSPTPIAIASATTQGSSSSAATALSASATSSTTVPCTLKGNVVATANAAPSPTPNAGYVVSGTVTNHRDDAITNALIYLSFRYSSGATDLSHTDLVAGQIAAGATQTWSQSVTTTPGPITAIAITQISYTDMGC